MDKIHKYLDKALFASNPLLPPTNFCVLYNFDLQCRVFEKTSIRNLKANANLFDFHTQSYKSNVRWGENEKEPIKTY